MLNTEFQYFPVLCSFFYVVSFGSISGLSAQKTSHSQVSSRNLGSIPDF
jgi:hypothetical protein